tara:strand:- start:3027 stop:3701 length:675 start_codon:yes stop_codon:yes gene_type:complete
MEDISFLDLEKNEDVYNIVLKYLINPSGKYTNKSITDFYNYTKANKKALLDPFIKKFISKCVIIRDVNNYFKTVDDFRDNWRCAFNMTNELHNHIIDTIDDNSIYSYDSINHIIFDTNYFEFDLNTKRILYRNIVNSILTDWNNNHLYSYYDIINKLIEVYDSRGQIPFRVKFLIFIKKLKNDLIQNNINPLIIDKLIVKFIKSINWTLPNEVINPSIHNSRIY